MEASVRTIVLELSPVTAAVHPQHAVDGTSDGFGLGTIGGRILAYRLGNIGGDAVGQHIVCRRMRDRATAVIEGVAGPDAAVGVVEMVAVGVEVAFLPVEVQLDNGEKLTHRGGVGGMTEMAQQCVGIDKVHVVVRHLVLLAGAAADVSVAIHGCAPAFFRAGKVEHRVLARMLEDGGNVCDLVGCVGAEVCQRTVVKPEGVTGVCTAPAQVRCAPSNRAVQPCLAAPDAVGSHGKGSTYGIEPGVGSIDGEGRCQSGALGLGLVEECCELLAGHGCLSGGEKCQIACLAGFEGDGALV